MAAPDSPGFPEADTDTDVDVEAIREPARDADDRAALSGARFTDRYERAKLLGIGGMGEVRAWRDRVTGREVAVKSIRSGRHDAETAQRFAREARIQAQLEHPSIVPVYDLGVGDDGLFFTMKRVRGHSLSRVLATLADRGEATAGYSQRKLLSVMARVAMALEFAHRRGVVNRDLKPANIMLGAFDEVYVLDWGVAALRDPAAPSPTSRPDLVLGLPLSSAALELPLLDGSQGLETGAGRLLGTPGYVAPEQIHSPDLADGRADVYALGAILFEILTGTRLHAGHTMADVVMSTLQLDGASPAARAPERNIAPELDELVCAATRLDPAARPARAADVARAIERYLDGDRDLERRRELAAAAAAAAADRLAAPVPAGGDAAAVRAEVMRDVGRALALDPDNLLARATMVRALTEPPAELPPAARALFRAAEVRAFRLSARSALLAMLMYVLYFPLLLWMGVRLPAMLAVMAASIALVMGLTWYYRERPPADLQLPWPHLAATTIALCTGVSLFGSLVLLPLLVMATGVAYIATFGRRMVLYTVIAAGVLVGPLALQLAGLVPRSYEVKDGVVRVLPNLAAFPPTATMVFLVVSHVVVVTGTLVYVWGLRRNYLDGERRLQAQAWTLAQLVPADDAAAAISFDQAPLP